MPRSGLIAVLLLMLWPINASAQLEAPGAGEDAYRTDARERRLRDTFPLHDRLWLRGGYAFGTTPSSEVEVGLSFSLDADFLDEEIWWQLRHDVARVRYQPQRRANLRLTLFEGDHLRHDTSSAILIPRPKNDIRLPAPFDIAVIWTLGRLDVSTNDGVLAADVAELALLADFIRDERFRHRLALGTCGRYGIARSGDIWRHEVVPFAGMTAIYGWEAASGRFAANLQPTLEYGAAIEVDEAVVWAWSARGQFEVEWVVLAINDLPLSIVADGAIDHAVGGATEWTTTLGAKFGVPLGI